MKTLLDILQNLLLDGGIIGLATWLILSVILLQVLKIVFLIFRMFGKLYTNRFVVLLRPSWITATFALFMCLCFWHYRVELNGQLQYIEQVYLDPVYVNSDTSFWAISMYEQELKRNVSESEFDIVKRETARMAYEIQASPLAIYEVAYSECRMNPFAVNIKNGDTVAVGWIQLTRAGINQINIDGRPVSWKQIKSWIASRNVVAMMEASRQYMITRAKGRALPTSTDVYIAVFAPGFIGYSDEQTLYSKASWPQAYYENRGMDGYGLVGDKIIKGSAFIDGKITVQDMRLHLALNKSKFLKS